MLNEYASPRSGFSFLTDIQWSITIKGSEYRLGYHSHLVIVHSGRILDKNPYLDRNICTELGLIRHLRMKKESEQKKYYNM